MGRCMEAILILASARAALDLFVAVRARAITRGDRLLRNERFRLSCLRRGSFVAFHIPSPKKKAVWDRPPSKKTCPSSARQAASLRRQQTQFRFMFACCQADISLSGLASLQTDEPSAISMAKRTVLDDQSCSEWKPFTHRKQSHW